MSALSVGVDERELRLPDCFQMVGYIRRDRVSQGTHDPLHVRALCVSDDRETVVLVVCELLSLMSEFTAQVAERIASRLGVLQEHVTICCTHTHSGPDAMARANRTEAYLGWMDMLAGELVSCALAAAEKRQPSLLSVHTSRAAVQQNRVLASSWGGTGVKSWEEDNWDERPLEELRRFDEALDAIRARGDEMLDPEVVALRVSTVAEPEKIHALLVNHPCHPVTLEYDNALYSADFPAYMARELRQAAPGAVVFFINGCCGDINPLLRGGFTQSELTGRSLARSVLQALEAGGTVLAGPVGCERLLVDIRYEVDYDEPELKRRLALYENGMEQARLHGSELNEKIYRSYLAWAQEMLARLRSGGLFGEIKADVRLLHLGGVVLVTLPFEVFCGVGRAIKEKLGPGTMVAAYANGDHGYLISEDLYDVAKYERFESYKFQKIPGPIAREAQACLLGAIDRFLCERGG